jgi:hypothetical protein
MTEKNKKALLTLITAITTAIITYLSTIMLSACTSSHKVVQSAYNTATGDSIVIRYEQTGNIKK